MRVGDVQVGRRKWDILLLTNRHGNKFVVAKSRTIYDTVLEINLERMYDGMIIAHEVNNNIIDDHEMSIVRQSLMYYRKEYVENGTENRNNYSKENRNRRTSNYQMKGSN